VPVYSHVYEGDGRPLLLACTLSVRNTDATPPITITSVRYYDTAGQPVRDDFEQPLSLAPLASTESLVEQQDVSGGSGANFMVGWVAGTAVDEPIVEAVMVGGGERRPISLIRSGVAVGGPHATDR
jgi:hypothetical protein